MATKKRKPTRPARGQPAVSSPRVSVVVPTTEARQKFHEQLWSVFDAQKWPDKELIVVDTYSNKASPFFTKKAPQDRRIVYVALKVDPEADFSIGLKRNMCAHLASGEYIANFDDDDLYAPSYLETMVDAMREQNSDAVTLGSWYVFECGSGKYGHMDPKASLSSSDPETADQWLFGYGFSYVFTRAVALELPYPNCSFGEDYEFFSAIRARNVRSRVQVHEEKGTEEELDFDSSGIVFGPPGANYLDPAGIALHFDSCGICLHTLHDQSTSDAWAQRLVPRTEENALEVAELTEVLTSYLHRFPRTRATSKFIGNTEELHRHRTLTIHLPAGDIEVRGPADATAEDVRSLVADQVGGAADRVRLYLSRPRPAGAELREAQQLQDGERVDLRLGELWATVADHAKDQCAESVASPVIVTIIDVPDFSMRVSVQIPSSTVDVKEVKLAIAQQHGRQDAGKFGKVRRDVKLARLEDMIGNAFVGVDVNASLGDMRYFFAPGLAEYIGRRRAPQAERGDLETTKAWIASVIGE